MDFKEYYKQRLIEDMAFDTAGMKASEKMVKAAERAEDSASNKHMRKHGHFILPDDHPAKQAYEKAIADHIARGSSDIVYTHDGQQFQAVMKLPKGLSNALAADAMRWGPNKLTKKQIDAAVSAANQLGGLHGVAGWEDPEISNKDMNYKVPAGVGLGRRITDPSRAAREWGNY